MINSYHSYIPSNHLDQAWGLYATACGFTLIEPQSEYPPVKHPHGYHFDHKQGRTLDEYQMIYITEGRGHFYNKTDKQIVNAGDMIILCPGQWHSYRPDQKTGWTEHWISFSGKCTDTFMGDLFFPRNKPVISIGLNGAIVELYNYIHNTVHEIQSGHRHSLASTIMQIAATVHDQANKESHNERDVAVVKAAEFEIHNAKHLKVDFEKLSAQLNVSYSHFRKIFKQQSGHSPYKYLQHVRMKRVKYLLNNTTESIGKIADITGFDTAYHFSNYFKQKTGYSPRAWRNI